MNVGSLFSGYGGLAGSASRVTADSMGGNVQIGGDATPPETSGLRIGSLFSGY